jgi:hypothetical protein
MLDRMSVRNPTYNSVLSIFATFGKVNIELVCKHTGLSNGMASHYLRMMQTEGVIYIADWKPDRRNMFRAVYELGKEPDVPKPDRKETKRKRLAAKQEYFKPKTFVPHRDIASAWMTHL